MNLKKVLLIFGKKTVLAQKVGVTNTTVSAWVGFGKVPDLYIERAKKALRTHKAKQDKAFNELLKQKQGNDRK